MSKKTSNDHTSYISIILDHSGSMDACRDETISGFNEQVEKITAKAKENGAEKTTFVSLTVFNHDVKFISFAEPISNLGKLNKKAYQPNGTTAMLDAVGESLTRFDREIEDTDETSYLVIIISDGDENDSKEFTYNHIAEMIQKRQKTGRWTFSYMGANQDLSDLSMRLTIPRSNMVAYKASKEGTLAGFESLSSSTIEHMDRTASGDKVSSRFFRKIDKIGSVDDDDDSGPLLH